MAFDGASKVTEIALRTDRDIARARGRVSELMKAKGARDIFLTRFVTAVSEITRNALTHGGGGRLVIYEFADGGRIGVECSDTGSGIADIGAALADGFSTRKGNMGRGLGGAKRLSQEFMIESTVGKGTIVRMIGVCRSR
ncbi:hypothetical protein CP97_10280 [Aurantiacibacter atlanticus]|uniref:Histidine kinase/HSP90-like ATPase domain-containing protein n=1 Tax=Aurantiacibacter atlanticus TaxID=1648404 RepID=A0A0H4VCD5_9SPHN|nr:ATP-binding protein [Aurantiacibacter atlanticus]AKQ42327.1 hypothetical protein CP97_10280 [Aurantiacibacter atlanticus]MDF1834799.1 ATP-binding protein [Alteraurantiacibacter sp. bin_em_oilr2.035]